MSNARKLADNLPSEGQLGGRNVIINGAMNVAQRGTSAVTINTSSEVFRADRFRFEQGSATANNGTIEVASDAPTGFKYSTKVTAGSSVTYSSTGFGSINYRIEGQDLKQLNYGTASAKSSTLSFWVKSSVTGTYSINITKYDGSSERFHVKTYVINSANTWEYKTITFVGDTSFSASSWMRLYWQLGGDSGAYNATADTWVAGSGTARGTSAQPNMITTSGATFYLTGVQLEVGSQSTPFEHEPYETTLRKCQRYFYAHISAPAGNEAAICTSANYSSTKSYGTVNFPVTMRSAPSLDAYSASNVWYCYYNNTNSTFDSLMHINVTPSTSMVVNSDNVSVTAGEAANLQVKDITNCYVHFDAEL